MFDVIYADPPWTYKGSPTTASRLVDNKYSTMTLDEICEIPVQNIAKDDAFLFLWVTSPYLNRGIRVIESWGFEWKTIGFVWVKTTKDYQRLYTGLGHYTRSNVELCLLGKRGRPKRMHKGIQQVIIHPAIRRPHSRKPDIARKRIEMFVGQSANKVELFATEQHDGWTCVGYDANGMDVVDFCERFADEHQNVQAKI